MASRDRPADEASGGSGAVATSRLSSQVRQRRIDLRLTVDAAAERCALDARHLQAIEAGATNVTLTTLVRLIRGLGLDPGALLAPLVAREATVKSPPARPAVIASPESLERALGERVRRLRMRREWSQRELATRASLSLGLVQSLEGASKSPTVRSLVLVARALGTDPAELLRQTDADGTRAMRSPPRARKPS